MKSKTEKRTSRRKPRGYKGVKERVNKTARRELTATERAFAVGACIAGGSTHSEVALYFPNAGGRGTIQKVVSRVAARAKETGLPITHPSLYESAPRSGRPELLNNRQKRAIIRIVTSDQQHREKEPWQAIADGDFSDIIP